MSEAAVATREPKEVGARRVSDPELIAMHEIVEALNDLDGEAQERIIAWARHRYESARPF